LEKNSNTLEPKLENTSLNNSRPLQSRTQETLETTNTKTPNKLLTFDRIFNDKKIGLKENFKDFHKMTGKVQSKIF